MLERTSKHQVELVIVFERKNLFYNCVIFSVVADLLSQKSYNFRNYFMNAHLLYGSQLLKGDSTLLNERACG